MAKGYRRPIWSTYVYTFRKLFKFVNQEFQLIKLAWKLRIIFEPNLRYTLFRYKRKPVKFWILEPLYQATENKKTYLREKAFCLALFHKSGNDVEYSILLAVTQTKYA